MREYLTDFQLIGDSLAGCGHPIEDMQHISNILNGVKEQYDNVDLVIYASRNLYDLPIVSSVLLDAETRQKEIIFDNNLSATNVVVKPSAYNHSSGSVSLETLDSGQSRHTDTGQQPQLTPEYQTNNIDYGHGRGRGRIFATTTTNNNVNYVASLDILCTGAFKGLMSTSKALQLNLHA